jgi:hypothetical protein
MIDLWDDKSPLTPLCERGAREDYVHFIWAGVICQIGLIFSPMFDIKNFEV